MSTPPTRSRAMTEREMLIELGGKFDVLAMELRGGMSAMDRLVQEQVANIRREQVAATQVADEYDDRLRKVEERDAVTFRQLWGVAGTIVAVVGTIVGITLSVT